MFTLLSEKEHFPSEQQILPFKCVHVYQLVAVALSRGNFHVEVPALELARAGPEPQLWAQAS